MTIKIPLIFRFMMKIDSAFRYWEIVRMFSALLHILVFAGIILQPEHYQNQELFHKTMNHQKIKGEPQI